MNKKIILLLLFCLLIPASIYASLDATVIHKVTGHRKVVQIGDPDAFTGGYILETPEIKAKYNVEDGDIAGAVKGFRPSGFSTTLASFLSEGGNESTLTVSSLTLPDGTTLNDSYYGDLLILTVGEGDSEEKISVSTLDESTKTFTIIDRGHEYGRLATSSSNILAHYPGDIVFVSNDDHFLNQQYIDLDSDQTISGTLTYTNYPEIETYTAPTEDEQFAPKKYVDETAFAGVSNGTETVKGIWEGATREEMASSTVTGGSGANLILKSEYATSSPDVRGINVVVSENDGYIDQDWLDLSEDFVFTGDVSIGGELTVTASTTLNATTTLADITSGHTVSALIASTTITGATTPQPVYIGGDRGGVLLSDANDTSALQFDGFAITSATTNGSVYVQTEGVVSGFTGLTPTSKYYVQDDKTIGTSVGTYKIQVGVAISETELLIVKEKSFNNYENKNNNTVYNAHTDGFVVSCYSSGSNCNTKLKGYTNENNPPTTRVAYCSGTTNLHPMITFPVKKGDYWKVDTTESSCDIITRWVPLN